MLCMIVINDLKEDREKKHEIFYPSNILMTVKFSFIPTCNFIFILLVSVYISKLHVCCKKGTLQHSGLMAYVNNTFYILVRV